MKTSLLKKVAIGFGILICLLVLIDVLLTEPISKNNTTLIKGHFSHIEQTVTRGEISYSLYITESQDLYKIPADWPECFAYDNFRYEVKEGQPIEIVIKEENHLLSLRKPTVVSIITNGRDYLDKNCIDQSISKEKTTVPLIFGTFVLFLIAVYIVKNNKKP